MATRQYLPMEPNTHLRLIHTLRGHRVSAAHHTRRLAPYACCAASTCSAPLPGFAALVLWAAPHSGGSPV